MHTPLAYPADSSQEIRIPVAAIQPVLEQLLVKNSVFQFDAVIAALRILEADLYGIPAHGCAEFCNQLEAISMGDVDPRARILTTHEAPAFAVLDGSRSLGHVAATKGAEMACQKAHGQGVAVVAVGNSQRWGAGEVYVRMMVQSGVIGLCCSSTGGPTVAAPGTRSGAVGNCDFAYGVPITGRHPLIFETTCGMESWGTLNLLKRYGIPIPEEWLFTSTGAPTSDPAQAAVLSPRGEALGFGLSLLCSILAGPLSGGRLPIHKQRRADAEDSQHFFLAIDLSQFCDPDRFQKELTTTLDEIRKLSPSAAEHPVRIPGDRGAECFQNYSQYGIPLHVSVAEEIKARALKKKIDVSW